MSSDANLRKTSEKIRVLRGMKYRDFAALLGRHGFDPEYSHRVIELERACLRNSHESIRECATIAVQIRDVVIHPHPIIVLGHWRSGTTLLQYSLAQDDRFGYITRHHAFHPYSGAPIRRFSIAEGKPRGVDNILITDDAPGEDEFAISGRSLCSPYVGFAFPRSAEHYDRFLDFSTATESEFCRWRRAILWILKKATLLWSGRQLIIKSPPHTARIRLLHALFPAAKFVHIHRHPREIMRSLYALQHTLSVHNYLQRPSEDEVIRALGRRYRVMFDAYFRDIPFLPTDALHSLGYDSFVSNPFAELERLYHALDLPDFSECADRMRKYCSFIADYQRPPPRATMPRSTEENLLALISPFSSRLGYA